MKILVTGAAGFIGFHLTQKLLRHHPVIGLDNLNDYYDVGLKLARLQQLGIEQAKIKERILVKSNLYPRFGFVKLDLTDYKKIDEVFRVEQFDMVCHLAAQAGVRYSLLNPYAYIESNLMGFLSILEACRNYHIKHLLYASSSSVYGLNTKMPFSVHDNVDHPVSLYGATKKSNELMAHSYSHLYDLPCTGLRFFTVYGPWGRPDMALYLFTKAILAGEPIDIFNEGEMKRDFTYIDDVVSCVIKLLDEIPQQNPSFNRRKPDPASSSAPYRIVNIGNSQPVRLMDFISAIEAELNIKAKKNFLPLQPGDVPTTWADTKELTKLIAIKPQTDVRTGVKRFLEWYLNYYGHKP